MRIFPSLCAAALLAAASSFAFSQAEIVDSVPMGGAAVAPSGPAAVGAPSSVQSDSAAQSELYFQLQMLQQEVQQLRGLVEEQAHELRRLKQQQLDDYVDLDRRVSDLSKKQSSVTLPSMAPSAAISPNVAPVVASPPSEAPGVGSNNAEKEYADYKQALRLILQDKQLEAGAEAMQTYLAKYPGGVYTSNAHYWLGQVAYSGEDLEGARKWFGQVIKNPESQKAPEAKYKLGVVLHKLGELATAKQLLSEVAGGSSSAGRLAQEYLRSHF